MASLENMIIICNGRVGSVSFFSLYILWPPLPQQLAPSSSTLKVTFEWLNTETVIGVMTVLTTEISRCIRFGKLWLLNSILSCRVLNACIPV